MTQPVFARPVRPWNDYKIDTVFCDDYYRTKNRDTLGMYHPGWDINIKTGGNTDLGAPVQSSFSGTVVSARDEGSAWGNVVLVRSDPWIKEYFEDMLKMKLETLDQSFGHLHNMSVKVGERVEAGDHLGSIGKGGWPWAHLHMEFRQKIMPANAWDVRVKDRVLAAYLDPERVFGVADFADRSNILPQRQMILPVEKANVNGNVLSVPKRIIVNGTTKMLYIRSE